MTGGNDHAERQSLLSRIGGVIIASSSPVTTTSTTTATTATSPTTNGAGYGTRRSASGGVDEESARQQFRMPYGYHMSMTNNKASLSDRTVLGSGPPAFDDHDDDSDNDSQVEEVGEDESHEIGYLGSYAIAINSLAGPAVLQLPFQYQQSGFVATTLALLGVAVVSVACSMYICRVVQAIPSTAKIERPVELSTVVDYFWSRKVRRQSHRHTGMAPLWVSKNDS